jgi:acetolactate synthase-1/2/3 large subunit
MKTMEAIVEIMKREGVEMVIGYPVNPILEFAARADIRPVIVRQERTGLHMADAISRVTSGKTVGVFVMQHGPGSENAFGGVAQAYADSVPILVIPMGYARRELQVPPNFSSALNFQHVVKSVEQLSSGSELNNVMRRAFTQVRNGRPGPVMVEVPMDVFGEDVGDLDYEPAQPYRSGPDPKAIERAADLLLAASRPVVYAGQGVHYAEAWQELRELAELLAVPVCTSLEGKSAFDETHPLALGSGGRTLPKPVRHFLDAADVIFGIGCSFTATAFGVSMPAGKTIVHSTLDPLDLNKDLQSSHAVLGDSKLVLQALLEVLRERRGAEPADATEVAAEIVRVRDEWLAEWAPKRTHDEAPLNPYRVLAELQQIVDPSSCIITHDSGSPRDQLSPFWQATTPLSYIGWGKSTQLGYGLGLAMGAKLAHPDKLCINVWGDAAIGFTGMDFETAVRERIPILSILLNNFCMAIELNIMKVSTEKYGSTDISGNYADMAKAFGGYGERVTEPGDIAAAIRRGIEQTENGTPALLEFITSKENTYSL